MASKVKRDWGVWVKGKPGFWLNLDYDKDMKPTRFTPAEAMSNAERMGPNYEARPLKEWDAYQTMSFMLEVMAIDNGIKRFLPTLTQRKQLRQGIEKMMVAGLKFTKNIAYDIAAGDCDEMAELYGKYKGFNEVNRVLGKIFNGPVEFYDGGRSDE